MGSYLRSKLHSIINEMNKLYKNEQEESHSDHAAGNDHAALSVLKNKDVDAKGSEIHTRPNFKFKAYHPKMMIAFRSSKSL